ncbi:MAG: hypothetical protein WDO14_13800 [Bacteroidota bacterium]
MSGFVFTILVTTQIFGQGEIPVSMYTGTPGIFINLYTLSDHDLSENISLSYNPGDLRLNSEHRYGVGWDISVGGQVSRKVRGLPDDYRGTSGDKRRGWLYNNHYSLTFPNADSLTSTYDESSGWTWVNNLADTIDTEPDLFTFSIGGRSGNFLFGNNGSIQLVPYQDILIVPTYKSSSDKTIIKWTVTTNDGVVYTLAEKCTSAYRLSKASNDSQGVNETMLNAFDRDFQYYQTSLTYYSSWMLSTALSTSAAKLTYTYSKKFSLAHTSGREALVLDAKWQVDAQHLVQLGDFSLMSESVGDTIKYVATIKTSTGQSVSMDPVDGVKVYDPFRSPTDSFKEFIFTYSGSFLTAVTETDHTHCNQMPPYKMYYANSSDYPLPEGTSMQAQDFWGYFNGAIDNTEHLSDGSSRTTNVPSVYVYPRENAYERYRLYPIPAYTDTTYVLNGNADRVPNPNYITHGTLLRLVYPTGGESDFTFESHRYWDSKAGRDQYGGGLRIKSILYYNGIDPTPNVTKNFTYVDGSGHSTGRLISRPSFSIPLFKYIVPTFGTHTGFSKLFSDLAITSRYRDLTLLTSWDLSDQAYTSGSAVGYNKVTVSRPGGGKVVFDYTLPASYGATGAGTDNTKWKPTTTKFLRPSSTAKMGIILKGEPGEYSPFPNALYDYERGLLLAQSEYNNSNVLVRYTQNTYQYIFKGSQPDTVAGFAYDLYAGSNDGTTGKIFLFGRYKTLANVAKVVSSQTVTTYDEASSSKHVKDSTHYTYGSSYHRYPTKITRTIPEGTVYGTSIKYTLDYPATLDTVADTQLNMILKLKAKNRNAVPIEQQSTIKYFGGTEKTTGASLIRFGPVSFYKPLLQYSAVFRPLTPVTDFVPSGVTSNAFTSDSRYENITTINEYTAYDVPLSSTGEDRRTSTMLYGYKTRVAVAQVSMARASEVAFSDFETHNNASFDSTNVYTGTGRTGATGVYPYATLKRTISKPSTASTYLLTFWLKNTTSSSVTLVVTLRDMSNTIIGTAHNYAFTLNSNNYQYFIQSIDVSSCPSQFKVEITGQSFSAPGGGSSPSLLPMLDDVAFYPDYASISTVTYDMPFGANTQTDELGTTSFTTYDGLGRVKTIRDKDYNIRKRFTYNMPGQVSPLLIAAVASHTGNYYYDGTDTFTAQDNTCIAGELYAWDFGEGSGFGTASTSVTSPSHTYLSLGNDTVTLKVTHADYAQPVTKSFVITVVRPPLTQTTCAGGVQTMNSSNVTTSRYDCITPSVPDGKIQVNVTAGNVYGSTLTYQWKKRDVGASTWNNVTGSNGTYPQATVNSTMNSFQLMCTVSANDGRTIDSDVITVTINH